MTIPPNSPVSSSLGLFVSTGTAYAQQEELLKEEVKEKQRALEQLRKVENQVSLYTGQINAITKESQSLLSKPPIQKLLPNQLTPTSPYINTKEQFEEVLRIAHSAQTGEALQQLEGHISTLNKKCGETRAQAKALEESVQEADSLIRRMEKLIAEKKQTLEKAKEVSKTADTFIPK